MTSSSPISAACDCHVHVVGPVSEFAQAADRSYTAAEAPVEALRKLGEPFGIRNFVMVQPSFYGEDHSFLLKSLDAMGTRGRGIASFDPDHASPAQLGEFAARGICGVRINLYTGAKPPAPGVLQTLLERMIAKVSRLPWQIEIIAHLPVLVQAKGAIAQSPLTIVINHYGLPDEESPDSEAGQKLLDLLRLPHVWMKLSAPYRVGADPLATQPPKNWLTAMLEAAPDRCVWGSDWPHTPLRNERRNLDQPTLYRPIDYSRLVRDFMNAMGDGQMCERIFIANPSRLYGFRPAIFI